ncbi:MAG TPA: 3'(2'),5'-bisphosphate nucleotidase CysQ, partial [Bacteroidales bacterium]|nr:3'(2'),5'-bisphosphate nucleotidase CysQ [Bacteroidales bacterium]
MQQLLRISIEACLKAGEATLAYYGKPVHVDIKSDNSPLTKADLASNTVINKYLIETEIPILSEENTQAGYAERKHWQKLWVVDPLDGTKEFIKKRKEYTINIALIENGNPLLGVIYAPILDELFFGLAGIASYKLTNASKNKYLLNDPMEVAEKITGHTSPTDLIVVASKSHLSPETEKFIKRIEEKASGLRVKSYGSSLKLCRLAEGAADIYP